MAEFSVAKMRAAGLEAFTHDYWYDHVFPPRVVWVLGVIAIVATLGWAAVLVAPVRWASWIRAALAVVWLCVAAGFLAGEGHVTGSFEDYLGAHHLASYDYMLQSTPWVWVGIATSSASAIVAAAVALAPVRRTNAHPGEAANG